LYVCTVDNPTCVATTSSVITPGNLRPHPKADARKTERPVKKGETMILTVTPVEDQIVTETRRRKKVKYRNDKAKKSLSEQMDDTFRSTKDVKHRDKGKAVKRKHVSDDN